MLIAHATADLSTSDIGFVCGAALAAAHGDDIGLLTLHVRQGDSVCAAPDVRHWLRQWGFPEDHVKHSMYAGEAQDDLADAVLAACHATHPDLLIMPTHARTGLARVVTGSVAESVARNLSIPSLLLPLDGRRLVSEQTGELALARVLVLGGSEADAQLGVDAAGWFIRALGHSDARVTLLHMFDRTPFPEVSHPPDMDLRVQHRAGKLVDNVVTVCAELQPQLLVSVSHGIDELRDVLRANRTERMLRATRRPLLWVPPTFPARRPSQSDGIHPA